MPFAREISRLLAGLLIAFGLTGAAALYWGVSGADTILLRPDNPRLVEAEARLLRGQITDRSGIPLVISAPAPGRSAQRQYIYPETNSVVGYASLRYGVSGVEAAFNALLRGDDRPRDWNDFVQHQLLHRPRTGSDIQLTLDLAIQQALVRGLDDRTGAGVVLAVPSGQVLALASLPTYDPNTLDADWERLASDPGKPFFNRAVQGQYQPGGATQSLLIAGALLRNYPLDTPLDTTRPVQVADVRLSCAALLPNRVLTLRDAYAFACPAPFETLASDLGPETLTAVFQTFALDQTAMLPGLSVPADQRKSALEPAQLATSLVKTALGQGELTVTPLDMALIAAAVVNDGSAPQPHLLLASRAPNTDTWRPAEEHPTPLAMTTANTARQLQDLMRLAVARGAAQNAARPSMDIGGHASLAYSGDQSYAWFIGFVTLGGRQGIAMALVIENSADPGLAADIGGSVLAVAHERLSSR